MNKTLVCTVCPMGCALTAVLENGKVIQVFGNTCPRGKAYAESEVENPCRTLTTTVKCADGHLLPVKTDRPVPRKLLFSLMKIINCTTCPLPIAAGNVIIENIGGSGANLVAAADASL